MGEVDGIWKIWSEMVFICHIINDRDVGGSFIWVGYENGHNVKFGGFKCISQQ